MYNFEARLQITALFKKNYIQLRILPGAFRLLQLQILDIYGYAANGFLPNTSKRVLKTSVSVRFPPKVGHLD